MRWPFAPLPCTFCPHAPPHAKPSYTEKCTAGNSHSDVLGDARNDVLGNKEQICRPCDHMTSPKAAQSDRLFVALCAILQFITVKMLENSQVMEQVSCECPVCPAQQDVCEGAHFSFFGQKQLRGSPSLHGSFPRKAEVSASHHGRDFATAGAPRAASPKACAPRAPWRVDPSLARDILGGWQFWRLPIKALAWSHRVSAENPVLTVTTSLAVQQRQTISILDKSKFGVSIDDVEECFRERNVQKSQASQMSVHQIYKDMDVTLKQV